MSILTATIAKVQIGVLEIDGLLLEDGNFGVGVVQANGLLEFSPHANYASQTLKRILGKGFSPHKVKVEGTKQTLNCIGLTQFEEVILDLAIAGNTKAVQLAKALVGLSLTQLFSDAHNIKFEKEERQQWLVARQTHAKEFHPLYTSWLKQDGVTTTYGTEVNRLKLVAKVPLTFVGEYNYEHLQKLNRVESAYDALRKAGLSHSKALEILAI